jgi:putative glutamine amidotransferase
VSRPIPLIGVTTYYAEASWGSWTRLAGLVPASYFELVAEAGARPMLLPPLRSAAGGPGQGASEVVEALDGLVLIGGGDLDPACYAATPHQEVRGVDVVRDQSEAALLAAALDIDLPVLAICRGHQLLNTQLGGTLFQHLPDVLGHREHGIGNGVFNEVDVVSLAGTKTAAIFGDKNTVQCSHHQGIDRLGAGLIVTARSVEPGGTVSDSPGTIEAVELPERAFVLGVQWHPEAAGDIRPFRALVDAART